MFEFIISENVEGDDEDMEPDEGAGGRGFADQLKDLGKAPAAIDGDSDNHPDPGGGMRPHDISESRFAARSRRVARHPEAKVGSGEHDSETQTR